MCTPCILSILTKYGIYTNKMIVWMEIGQDERTNDERLFTIKKPKLIRKHLCNLQENAFVAPLT